MHLIVAVLCLIAEEAMYAPRYALGFGLSAYCKADNLERFSRGET